MDYASLYTDLLFPYMVTSSSFRRLLETSRGIRTGADLFKHKLLSPTCWAIGVGSASNESFLKGSENGSLLGAFDESAFAPFVTLEAEITPETIDFFVSEAEGDPDCPTQRYSSIEQALHTLREGKFVIVVDDENGDIEGNLIMAASLASPQQVSFLIKNGSGIVSVGMKEEDLERLKLPLMSPETENEDSTAPTFTITVDAKSGTCTGVSASDRAKIVLALSSPKTKPEDFRRPGHVFPLKYRNGGVLRRAGHTEASVDLGEKYKLIWPEQSEFVRLAARFGAKTVLFGAVGEDESGEVRPEFEHLKFDSSALYTLQFGLPINPDRQIGSENDILRVRGAARYDPNCCCILQFIYK
uniref:3,4-dihydroxy-2-butanone-4-phosphate synthase n=1 Tax=Populus alba TaxID=43335 RepID=A0A4U5QD51_POPAL|nr:hypothetical protein D5086_0000105910 [Populus alba]